jgi:hypothetical protein
MLQTDAPEKTGEGAHVRSLGFEDLDDKLGA